MYQNGLIKKIRLISSFMTSQPGYRIVAITCFPISREENQSDNEIWSVNRIQHEKHFS